MRYPLTLVALTCALGCSESSSKNTKTETPEPSVLTFDWTPDPMAAPQALATSNGVILRESKALIFVETTGRVRWRRELEKTPEVVVALTDGTILATNIDGELNALEPRGGQVTAVAIPSRALAGVATDDGALLVTDSGLLRFRSGEIDERRRRHGGPARSVALAPNGSIWIDSNSGWTALDPSGGFLFAFIPEGFEASSSFPPVFVGNTAWMFLWREGRSAEIVAIENNCKPIENEARHLGDFTAPKRCITSSFERPKLSREPTVSSSRGVVVFGHGSGPDARYVEALRDGKQLWRKSFSRLGMPPEVLACGNQVVVLTDGGVTHLALETGATLPTPVEYALEAVCVDQQPVLVQPSSIVLLPPSS